MLVTFLIRAKHQGSTTLHKFPPNPFRYSLSSAFTYALLTYGISQSCRKIETADEDFIVLFSTTSNLRYLLANK